MVLVGEILAQLMLLPSILLRRLKTRKLRTLPQKPLLSILLLNCRSLCLCKLMQKSHDRIRELETQLGALQQKLQQKEAAASNTPDPTSSPKTPHRPRRVCRIHRSVLQNLRAQKPLLPHQVSLCGSCHCLLAPTIRIRGPHLLLLSQNAS